LKSDRGLMAIPLFCANERRLVALAAARVDVEAGLQDR
jgi:hypothetical protein